MKFKKEWPTVSGYYWYVDNEYPIPKIGFIQGSILYLMFSSATYGKNDEGYRKHIRIGDKIEEPQPKDNTVE